MRIHENETDGGLSEHVFFLEVDRRTEGQSRLAAKAACYISYYKSGGPALRLGHSREDYAAAPTQVLFVFKTKERRDNTARNTARHASPDFDADGSRRWRWRSIHAWG